MTQPDLIQGPDHTTTISAASSPPRSSSNSSMCTRVSPSGHGATFTYRAWLLHLLHIHLVRWRGIQPPYCFRGATATRWSRSASLGLTYRITSEGVPRPLSFTCIRAFDLANLILVHYSCRRFLACWLRVQRSHLCLHLPTLSTRRVAPRSFLGRGRVLPPSGVQKLPPDLA